MPDRIHTASNDCVLAFDCDEKKFLFISPDICDILGYSPAHFHQNYNLPYEITHINDRDWVAARSETLAINESISINYRVKTLSGTEKWILEKRSLSADASGHRVLMSIIKDDTEEKKEYQEPKNKPLDDLSFLFDNNPNPMWVYQVSSLRILKVNKAAIKRYGYSEDEFLTMTPRDLRPPGDIEKFNRYVSHEAILGLQPKGVVYSGVWKHQNKKGELIFAEIICQDVKYEDSDCRVVVAADVTEKMRFEEELIWAKNSLEALINNTDDQIWSVDRDTRYVYMNKAYRDKIAILTGVEPKEGDHSRFDTRYNGHDMEKWEEYYQRALNGEHYTIINESIDPATKQTLSFEINFNPIYKNGNEITGIGCFARNITERLKSEKAIIDQNERLRKIAMLSSHELRRPVASMLGLINIMDKDNFYNPDNREIIQHILTVGSEMDEMIHLIVDKTFTDELPVGYQLPA